jgi:UDP-N-acetylmuramate--alanine ligase
VRIEKTYHFIGIGGISMSGLARILLSLGIKVQGSDTAKSNTTKSLEKLGVKVFYKHNALNLGSAGVVVYTDAIKKDNPEFVAAKQNNLIVLSRAELLEEVSKRFKKVIAISGSHGKTTTTGMITEVFKKASLKPTAHIGGVLKSENSSIVLGEDKEFFITEACEYKSNFLHLKPTVGVILNIEKEHMDYFKTFKNVVSAYQSFANNCEHLVKYEKVETTHEKTLFYGAKGYNARKVKKQNNGCYCFDCYFENKKLFKVKLNVIGKHNIYNALATIAVAKHFNIDNKTIIKTIEQFSGILRRFEVIKEKPYIVHDYAHHPSEIESCILATRGFKKDKIVVAFQPHTYSRTQSLMPDFEKAFSECDELLIIKTYSAREKYVAQGSARALYNYLKKKHKKVLYFKSFESAREYLIKTLRKKDTLLVLGAGNIDKLARTF